MMQQQMMQQQMIQQQMMQQKMMQQQLMQQQQMNSLNQALKNQANSQNQPDNNNLNVIFKVKDIGAITIQIQYDQKVAELINKYRGKTGDREPQKKFIFNGKSLNPSLSCAEAGLTNNSIVFVLNTKDVEGA